MALHRVQQHTDLVGGSEGTWQRRSRRVDRDDIRDYVSSGTPLSVL